MFVKDPGAELVYRIDWSDGLSGGLEISDSMWTIDPPDGRSVQVEAHGHDEQTAHVRLKGGEPGAVCRLSNRVTMSDGTIDERSMLVRVEER